MSLLVRSLVCSLVRSFVRSLTLATGRSGWIPQPGKHSHSLSHSLDTLWGVPTEEEGREGDAARQVEAKCFLFCSALLDNQSMRK